MLSSTVLQRGPQGGFRHWQLGPVKGGGSPADWVLFCLWILLLSAGFRSIWNTIVQGHHRIRRKQYKGMLVSTTRCHIALFLRVPSACVAWFLGENPILARRLGGGGVFDAVSSLEALPRRLFSSVVARHPLGRWWFCRRAYGGVTYGGGLDRLSAVFYAIERRKQHMMVSSGFQVRHRFLR